jgi:16S rRNA (cytosine1402-N4)-methyltransferase
MKKAYHIPVLLHEAINGLNIKSGGVYIDVTFGGGGHSRAILNAGSDIKLLAFDKDANAEKNAEILLNENFGFENKFSFFRSDFKYVKNFVTYAGYEFADGLLADLGVSSHQFDEAERGFSFRQEADLDMRMNRKAEKNAAQVVNEYTQEELTKIFKLYGELKKAGYMAKLIAEYRKEKPVKTTFDLNAAVSKALPKYNEYKILAQLYQALRIEVNDELKGLERLLQASADILAKGGRLVVLTYHSLEDRIVKNYIKSGNVQGIIQKDIYGNAQNDFNLLKPKFILPSEKEIEQNSRAASAKLRIAERI